MGKRAPADRDPVPLPRSGHAEHTNGKAWTPQVKHRPGTERDQGGVAPCPSSARSSCSHGPRRKLATVKSSPDHHRPSTLAPPPVPACQTSISRRAPDGASRILKMLMTWLYANRLCRAAGCRAERGGGVADGARHDGRSRPTARPARGEDDGHGRRGEPPLADGRAGSRRVAADGAPAAASPPATSLP